MSEDLKNSIIFLLNKPILSTY